LLWNRSVKSHEQTVAVLSDQTLFRQGAAELLRLQGFRSVAEYATSAELLAGARHAPPDVLMVDLDHEREDTMTLVRSLRHELPGTHLVVIGTAPRQAAAGATPESGVETPSSDAVALAGAALIPPRRRNRSAELLEEQRRWSRITPRQRDVLRWLSIGASNHVIAHKLRISERAVKAHVSTLLHELDVENRTQLALVANRAGLQPPLARARA
jgi:DNA-binding NarL/FixJ family response regulator